MNGSITSGRAPSHGDVPSGRFVLRLTPALHAALRAEAAVAGVSLNEHCTRILAGGAVGDAEALALVERVVHVVGAGLVGIVAYGSWARGTLADGSDIDLLVVVDAALPITRESYRSFDDPPLCSSGRRVDVHLVHLPLPGASITGTWVEAATEGIVLRERGLELSRRLVDIRRRIAAGEIVRRVVHGQPYWVRGS